MNVLRRMPIGAEVRAGGTHFRLWAPACRAVEVAIEGGSSHRIAAETDGYVSAEVPGVRAGTRYRFRLDGDGSLYPDPASRFQPEGPHGPSEVVDPAGFLWGDDGWNGVSLAGQVLYEM